MSDLKRAALIVEMDDGKRMLYELHGPIILNVEYGYPEAGPRAVTKSARATIEGMLGRGIIWAGDMPTAKQPELTEPQKEIDA